MTFEQRCTVAQQCLPQAEYRERLTALHTEMLARIAELESEAVGYQAELAGYEHSIGHLSALVDELRGQASEHQLTMQQAHDALVAATPVKNSDVQTQVDAVLALRKALEASTQPVASPGEPTGGAA
jgi:chromosome segregation ATPase